MRKPTFRGALVGTTVGFVAFGGVAAAAFWTTGAIHAPVTAGQVVVADVTATVEDELYPGYLNDLELTFTNPNAVETRVTEVVFQRFTGESTLLPHLVAEPVLAPGGRNPSTGEPRPLVLPPGGTVTVTVPDVVGLRTGTPNAGPGPSRLPMQSRTATVVYSATYTASPGTETARFE